MIGSGLNGRARKGAEKVGKSQISLHCKFQMISCSEEPISWICVARYTSSNVVPPYWSCYELGCIWPPEHRLSPWNMSWIQNLPNCWLALPPYLLYLWFLVYSTLDLGLMTNPRSWDTKIYTRFILGLKYSMWKFELQPWSSQIPWMQNECLLRKYISG